MIIKLSILVIIFTKVTNSVPGFEFEDNRAAKYLTDQNGVAEITFQERIDNFRLIFLITLIAAYKSDFFLRLVLSQVGTMG